MFDFVLFYLCVIVAYWPFLYVFEKKRHKGLLSKRELLVGTFGMSILWPITSIVNIKIVNE